MAAMAALGASALVKTTAGTAHAANGDPVILGAVNNATTTTQINNPGSGFGLYVNTQTGGAHAVFGESGNGRALWGAAHGGDIAVFGQVVPGSVGKGGFFDAKGDTGVQAQSDTGAGLKAISQDNNGIDVFSNSAIAANIVSQTNAGIKVGSNAGAPGVDAQSISGVGVRATGVIGVDTTGFGAGGKGVNAVGGAFGVFATSSVGRAVYAETTSGPAALHAKTSVPPPPNASQVTSYAGLFEGPVRITSHLEALGTKAAIVPFNMNPNDLRRMYCQESTEAWFEDFGEAQLVGGRAVVAIPTDFSGVSDLSLRYYVFLTAHSADLESLAVTARMSDHFVVEANGKGVVEGSFAYRIVAKRKDVPSPRMPRVLTNEAVSSQLAPQRALDVQVPAGPPPPLKGATYTPMPAPPATGR